MRSMSGCLVVLVLTSVLVSAAPASAEEVITVCGKASGKSFDLESNEWSDDKGLMNQSTTIVRDDSGNYDILYKDAVTTGSVTADGAKVLKLKGDDDQLLTLVAVYPQRVIEVYQLTLDSNGNGGLIWSSFKNRAGSIVGMPVTLGTLLSAKCSK